MLQNLKPRILLAIIIIPIACIVAAIPNQKTQNSSVSAEEITKEILSGAHYISFQKVADYIITKDPSVLLVDVRELNAYNEFHLPESESFPLQSIVADSIKDIFSDPTIEYILYSNGTVKANQAYNMVRLNGIDNVLVMAGGLNAWGTNITNATKPSMSASEDEQLLYSFGKAVSKATNASSEIKDEGQQKSIKKTPPKKRKKKKRVAGGC